ncbi:MAG: CDP-glucose 4,6-dehydratase [Alphaproteobacteria bacterium]|nr:CDP-glucose 4,6-dehydratase [Alphaproteobacteria bacterium]
MSPDPAFWRGRRVLLTGHTGFKGAWLTLILSRLGAEVTGVALAPHAGPALFPLLAPACRLDDYRLDITSPGALSGIVHTARPSIVLHLAAQALVPVGYADPAGTFATNLTGTIHLLEALRGRPCIDAALVVTTDKVYRNAGDGRRFREDDPLGGADPYSASKAAAELAVAAWRASHGDELPPLATARAGNVIGGGDFAPTRLVPDIVRAWTGAAPLLVRHPDSTRPWQHVLDVLRGYLLQAEHLATPAASPPALNFAPSEMREASVRDVIASFSAAINRSIPWQHQPARDEAPRLALDAGLAERTLGWRPRLGHTAAIAMTADWYAAWHRGDDMLRRSIAEIEQAVPCPAFA